MGDVPEIVIDNGSGFCKAGFAGEDEPRVVLPSVVARDRLPSEAAPSDVFVGNDAQSRRGPLIRSSPIEHGIITDWDDMEKIWEHFFHKELRIDPALHTVLLTDGSNFRQIERMAEIMFETFGVQGLYLQEPATLSLHASGRTSGVVLDSGHDLTHVVSIREGIPWHQSIVRMDFAGLDLNLYMTKMLNERGLSFRTVNDREIVQDIKEKLCYAALDFEKEKKAAISKSFELPDGTVIKLGEECLLCPEVLFNPSLIGKEEQGVQHAIVKSIEDSDNRIDQDVLYSNIVLAGGSTMFEGFADKLTKALKFLAPNRTDVNVLAYPQRRYPAWLGGSLQASQHNYNVLHVPRADYQNVRCDLLIFKIEVMQVYLRENVFGNANVEFFL